MSDINFISDELEKNDIFEKPHKVLVVDDDEDVRYITEMVLKSISNKIQLIFASGEVEAIEILNNNKDIAIAMLDIVMETTESGFNLIRYIREVQENNSMYIVVRTGQSGERRFEGIIKEFDIDDYEEKTEMFSTRLRRKILLGIAKYNRRCKNNNLTFYK